MQGFQEEKHRDQREKAKNRKIRAFPEDQVEKFHQRYEALFVRDMSPLIDQLEIQPVDPVITAYCDTTGGYPGQQPEDGDLRHQVPRLLPVIAHTGTGQASAGQISRRVGTVTHKAAKSKRYRRQYDIYQCTFLHVGLLSSCQDIFSGYFLSMSLPIRSIYLRFASRMPSRIQRFACFRGTSAHSVLLCAYRKRSARIHSNLPYR